MKPFLGLLSLFLLINFITLGQDNLKTYQSQHDFEKTISMIKSSLSEKDIKVMQVFDHDKNAQNAGLELEKTKVLVFGNPQVGTKLMKANPDIALELPLRLLVIEREGNVMVKHIDPTSWEAKYNLQSERETLANMAELLTELGRTVEMGK